VDLLEPSLYEAATPMSDKHKRLPVIESSPRTQLNCLTCGLCCTYLAVEISAPDSVKAATEILWHLYHESVSVYRDSDDEWMVQFETRCKHLATDNKCAIYEHRPQICRDYEADTCEVNADDEGRTFYDARDFLGYLKTRSTRLYSLVSKRFMPADEHLGRAVPGLRPMAPFDQRFAKLRKKGLAKPARARA
jgi:Fe-S-cluster containining protein